ncbi:hypothetical protein LJR219_004046 [Phenylobacterium sp. LjRoot219]|uniref:calcium-binding protein n=1 Tax=Phenylobacterium sp. LjRoot219 TaxID=3342283 RepID=UPI003ECE67BA
MSPDQVFVVTNTTQSVEGDGVLNFGRFQATFTSLWNGPGMSGGRYLTTDPATGVSGSIDFQNITGLIGSTYGDYLVANAQIASISGEGGDDTVTGQSLDAPIAYRLRGGEGADSIAGADLADNVNGNQGDDRIRGGDGGDTLLGGQGADLVQGDEGADLLNGNRAGDTVDGGAGADTVRGGQGEDAVLGGTGDDILYGDLGSDTLPAAPGPTSFT